VADVTLRHVLLRYPVTKTARVLAPLLIRTMQTDYDWQRAVAAAWPIQKDWFAWVLPCVE
jgi:hypothetical protein